MLQPRIRRFGNIMEAFPEVQLLRNRLHRLLTAVPYSAEFPAVNVWMGKEDALLTIELPGVDPEKLELSIEGGFLRICGSRPAETGSDIEGYYRQERSSGSFTRTLQLPFKIDVPKVEALYEKGILQVSLPRVEAEKPIKIPVKKD